MLVKYSDVFRNAICHVSLASDFTMSDPLQPPETNAHLVQNHPPETSAQLVQNQPLETKAQLVQN